MRIKTLSPVHIGSGDIYNGLSYLVNSDKIFLFDSNKVMDNLTDQEKELFVQWIEEQTHEITKAENQMKTERDRNRKKQIRGNIRMLQNKFNLKWFLERVPATLRKFYSNYSYCVPAFNRVYDAVNIECFIKQNDNKIYIPGTEIKGAIRTAILYYLLLTNKEYYNQLVKWLNEFNSKFSGSLNLIKQYEPTITLRNEKKIKQPERKIENSDISSLSKDEFFILFGGNGDRREKYRIKDLKEKLNKEMGKIEDQIQKLTFRSQINDDAKYDLLKFLHIGDTKGKLPQECLFVGNVTVEGLTNRNISLFQELCKQDEEFEINEFRLTYDDFLLSKLGFSDKQKEVIKDENSLFKCCYEFSKRLLEEEKEYFKNREEIFEHLNQIERQNEIDSPVIRIGKGEGYFSLTLGLLIRDKNPALYKNVLIHATKNVSYTDNFPKTRRIVNCGRDKFTLGWVKLGIRNSHC